MRGKIRCNECETVWTTDFPIRLETQWCDTCKRARFTQDLIGVELGECEFIKRYKKAARKRGYRDPECDLEDTAIEEYALFTLIMANPNRRLKHE